MQVMADFWYDVIRPIYGWLPAVTLSTEEKVQLLHGFKYPKIANPTNGPVFIQVTALLDSGIEGGMRLIDVLSKSPQRCNQYLAHYLRTTWDRCVRNANRHQLGPAKHKKGTEVLPEHFKID